MGFKQLKELKLEKHSFSTSLDDNFDSIIDSCKSLETLDIRLQHLDENSTTKPSPPTNNSITPHLNIKNLCLKGRLNNDNATLYIMLKFPNLQSIDILDTYYSMTSNLSPSVFPKFLQFILKIPSHNTTSLVIGERSVPDTFLQLWTNMPLEDVPQLKIFYHKPACSSTAEE